MAREIIAERKTIFRSMGPSEKKPLRLAEDELPYPDLDVAGGRDEEETPEEKRDELVKSDVDADPCPSDDDREDEALYPHEDGHGWDPTY